MEKAAESHRQYNTHSALCAYLYRRAENERAPYIIMLTSLRYLAGTAGPSGFGSRTTAEEATACTGAGDLRQVTAIITGATSGIGAETARVLAKRGARLVLPARSLKAAERRGRGSSASAPAPT
ncbi:hypothetical protein PR202_gb18099 [Eleusine coracana subsp. coracana]|uniref:Uncharacterized protein n=1 Tax=Eleusine coracana subsp. coracana TaxID=191504 RepID=A0AAV5F487_ELECO|nr:hypothetical protein PR202_gb18032 [Eleusine coracana subsp. coracana]GJN29843.1 hypothetical protein PR202_gb18099 [Eleusine coracana subsp. coracana]